MPETEPPAPAVEPPKVEPGRRRISAVWLVPFLALVIALAVAWRTYQDRGPLIEIAFENAAGVEANATALRFRDVTIGVVESIDLSEDLANVIVRARIDKDIARFLDRDAQFWVVRPSVTAEGVTGIETVLSGVYIEASWDDEIGERVETFRGLSRPPLTPANQPGLRVRLRANDGGSMNVGAPVLFKRIQVGRIEDIRLTEAGDVSIVLFVNAPHHRHLTQGTRFWNASGFSISLDAAGASLNVDSLISLLQGGVSFDTIGSDATQVEPGHVYELYPSENAARQNLFQDEPGPRLMLDVNFDGSVRGLEPGAPVEYHGIQVGEVQALQAAIVQDQGRPRITLRATLSIVPRRLGIPEGGPADPAAAALALIEEQVAQGMRARLASSGLLAQTLYVELAEVPDAVPATIDMSARPNPLMPSVPSEVSGIAASAEGIFDRLAGLPLEALVQNAVSLLANANALVSDDRIRAAPENLGLLLADMRRLISDSGIQEAPAELSALLASARALVDQATEAQLVANLSGVLEASREAVASVDVAADGVPELLAEIETLSSQTRELPLERLVASATRLADNMDAFVQSQELQNLPASAQASLGDLRALVEALRAGGAVENVNATLASVRQVTDEFARAEFATSLETLIAEMRASIDGFDAATADVPALVTELDALSEQTRALPLDQLVASGTRLADDIDAFIKSQQVTALPGSLNASLAELRTLIEEFRAGGAVENVNATLASVRQMTDELAQAQLAQSLDTVIQEARLAAGNVSAASEDLPELIDSLTTLSTRASELPLDELVANGTRVLATADSFLGSEGVGEVPPRLAAALEELRAILTELRAGGAVANVNTTLTSATRAADAVSAAAADLPALIAELNRVAAEADAAIASFSPGSDLNRDTLQLLREVREAVRSFEALVSALERRPNSVLFGR